MMRKMLRIIKLIYHALQIRKTDIAHALALVKSIVKLVEKVRCYERNKELWTLDSRRQAK